MRLTYSMFFRAKLLLMLSNGRIKNGLADRLLDSWACIYCKKASLLRLKPPLGSHVLLPFKATVNIDYLEAKVWGEERG